jgi:glycosyltransferase involved in cell wall biosynthesis
MGKGSNIRIALVTSSLRLAGAEKQTVYMARALRSAGIAITCFFLGGEGHYETELRKLNVPVCRIYKRNRPWVILTRLIKALYEFRPHIMFAPQFGDLLQGGIAGRLCQSLVIGGLRSDGLQELKVNRRRSPWMIRLAHGILANSRTGRQNFVSHGVEAGKIRVMTNVIDLREFGEQSTAPVSIPIPKDRLIAAAVGTLQPGKRFDRFVDALCLARLKAPALFGVVAGADRGSRAELEERARRSGLLPNHMAFIGECLNVPALLARSAYLVVSSEFEGYPNTLLESMAAGLPVITTPVGDAPSIVRHNETGYVLSGGEVTEMADYMVRLALSAETRGRFGANAKRLSAESGFETLQVPLLKAFSEFAAKHRKPTLLNRLQNCLSTTTG